MKADGDIVQSGIAVRGIIVQGCTNHIRFAIVTMRWARDAMEALGAQDERARRRTAKPCGSDASTLASSLVEVSMRRR
jgi:hypothetical protein